MNPHGGVVQLLNEAGKVIKSYHYDAFGNEEDIDKKDTNPYRYSGEYYDKETDTIYLRARYYDPDLGRFLTRDTYTGEEDDPLSLHLYTYCANDGVNNVDPSGHALETLIDIVSLGDSIYSFKVEQSKINAVFLVWDTAAVILPFAPGAYLAKIPKYIISKAGKGTKIAVKSEKLGKYVSKIAKGAKSLGKSIKNGIKSAGKSIKSSKVGKWFGNKVKKLSSLKNKVVKTSKKSKNVIKAGSKTGPYAYLKDGPTVGAGKDFTATQKQKMLEENMKRNGGVVKSDNPNDYYVVLTKPKKSMKGVSPDPNEWQFDHIQPKSKGGTNSYSNCQIVSRKYNRKKWDIEE